MSAWGSYRIQDFLLFSKESLLDIIATYNQDFWPWQLLGLGLAGVIFILLVFPSRARLRIGLVLVAAGWVWVAWIFQLRYFLTINWAARYTAVLGFAEALLLLAIAYFVKLEVQVSRRVRLAGLILYALSAFVPWELAWGHEFSYIMIFGWGPERTALGTLGLLLLLRPHALTMLALVPALLSLVLSLLMFYGLK